MLVSRFPVVKNLTIDNLGVIRAQDLGLYHKYEVGFHCRSDYELWNHLNAKYTLISTASGTGSHAGMFVDAEPGTESMLIVAQIEMGRAFLYAHSKDPATSRMAMETLRMQFLRPPPVRETPEEIEINFWHNTPMGPKSFSKYVLFPRFEAIRDNYTADIQDELTKLMGKKPRQSSGMILWTGPPGGGKTTALRALAKEWDAWCDVQIIADPEKLLNDMPYLYQVATSGYKEATLIVLEDSGELIATDAKKNSGQALSRLLNITDGILGQGLNCYFLLTTNEPIGELHAAAARPGRAVPNGNTHFGDLTVEEANAWLERHELEHRVEAATSLATLYSQLSIERPVPEDDEEEEVEEEEEPEVRLRPSRSLADLYDD